MTTVELLRTLRTQIDQLDHRHDKLDLLAMVRALDPKGWEAERALYRALGGGSLLMWCGRRSTTKAHVLALVDRALHAESQVAA